MNEQAKITRRFTEKSQRATEKKGEMNYGD